MCKCLNISNALVKKKINRQRCSYANIYAKELATIFKREIFFPNLKSAIYTLSFSPTTHLLHWKVLWGISSFPSFFDHVTVLLEMKSIFWSPFWNDTSYLIYNSWLSLIWGDMSILCRLKYNLRIFKCSQMC